MKNIFPSAVAAILVCLIATNGCAATSAGSNSPNGSGAQAPGQRQLVRSQLATPDPQRWFIPTPSPADTGGSDLAAGCRDFYNNKFMGLGQVDELRNQLNVLEQSRGFSDTPEALVQATNMKLKLGMDSVRFGEYAKGLAILNEAVAQVDKLGAPRNIRSQFYFSRGSALLRLGESANCGVVQNANLCLISFDKGRVYENQNELLLALDDFQTSVELDPTGFRGVWMINIVNMLLRTYPDGVPEKWRIPPERFESKAKVPKFVNIAQPMGMAHVNMAGGAVMDDMDGDGFLDVVTSNVDPCQQLTYYHNEGNGRFVERTAEAGLLGEMGGITLQQTDYNNDGNLDLFITRGGWQRDSGRVRRSLMRNNGNGTFTDVSFAAGIALPAYPTQASAWADYDLDGDLDVYIGNEINDDEKPYPSQLMRNNGDGTFTDVAAQAGVLNNIFAKGVAWGDYDNDGDPDLYVSNIGPNRLYRNNGDGTFTDVAADLNVQEPKGRSFGTWFWDYDNDGWLDIYVAGYDMDVQELAREYLGQPWIQGEHPKLYHNNGHGGFDDVTAQVGLDQPREPMGNNFGDIDNDGWLDFYLGTGNPDLYTIMPNVMYHNDHGRHFEDVSLAAGVAHLPKGHGIAFGDLDNDGDQDIFLEAGAFGRGDTSPNALFENPGVGNNWLTVKLVGRSSNRIGMGARIKLVVDDVENPGKTREIHVEVTTGGTFGANSLQQEIGIGKATKVQLLEITWPGKKDTQRFADVAANQFVEVTEGQAELRKLVRPVIRLGGKGP